MEERILPLPRASALPREHCGELANEVIALFDTYRVPLLRYVSSFGLSESDREDMIQEVFLSLFSHLKNGKPRDNLQGWLFRVAHNLALRQRYRSRRESDAEAEDRTIDPAPGPEVQAAEKQTRQRLLAVVDALSEQDRRCLILRAEGLRYREIASILEMSLGAISISLSRSLARMARVADR